MLEKKEQQKVPVGDTEMSLQDDKEICAQEEDIPRYKPLVI